MRASAKRIINRIVSRAGYSIIANWRLEHLEQANYLRRLFPSLQIDCVVDVGANIGQYRSFLRNEVGFNGHIVSFEPVPQNVEALKKKADTEQDAQWIIRAMALGSSQGVTTFNVMKHTALSSFLNPDHTYFDFAMNRIDHQIQVEVSTLDVELPALRTLHGWKSVYLKLDTQGYDMEVMKGATNVASTLSALQTEVCIRPIYQGMPDFAESITAVQNMGFEVSGMFPTNYEAFPLLLEVDCHFVARSVRDQADRSKSPQIS